ETYILPLVNNREYDAFRRITGEGTAALEPAYRTPNTLAQFFVHISPEAAPLFGRFDWALAPGEQGQGLRKLSEDWVSCQFDLITEENRSKDAEALISQLSLLGATAATKDTYSMLRFFLATGKEMTPKLEYKGVTIVRLSEVGAFGPDLKHLVIYH